MNQRPQCNKPGDPLGDSVTRDRGKPVEGLSLRHNMAWNSAGSLVYLVCQYLITVLLVRITESYADANTFSSAANVYSYFMPLAVYRIYTYQVSDVRHENTLGEYFTFRMITSGAALVLCILYAVATSPAQMLPAIVLYAVYKTFSLLIDILHGTDQLNRRMDYIGISFIVQGVGSLVAFGGVFVATRSLEAALGSMIGVTVIVGIAYDYPRARQFEPIKIGIPRKKALGLLRNCFPVVVAAVACAAIPAIPRQILTGEPGDLLGIYMLVAAPAAIIQMGASYLYGPVINVFSELYSAGRTKELRATFLKVVVGIMVIGIVCVIGLEVLGPFVLTLMSGSIVEPYMYLLFPIAISVIVSAYVWFFSDLLVALRCFKGCFIGNIVALIVMLPAAYLFVAGWGMNGVSFAIIVSYATGALIMVWYIVSLFKRSAQQGRTSQRSEHRSARPTRYVSEPLVKAHGSGKEYGPGCASRIHCVSDHDYYKT